MTENVINHQIDKFSREKGIDPESMTAAERKNIRAEMLQENYPGNIIQSVSKLQIVLTN